MSTPKRKVVKKTGRHGSPISDEQIDKQVGGNHYKRLVLQPMEVAIRNRGPWAEYEICKYVQRWEYKGGVNDLKKAAHILQALIEYAESDEYVVPADSPRATSA